MNRDRLKTLANHLLSDKLGFKTYDGTTFNSLPPVLKSGRQRFDMAGERGDAIGECVFAFPNDWVFDVRGNPAYDQFALTPMNPVVSACVFFDISIQEYREIFKPAGCATAAAGKILRYLSQ